MEELSYNINGYPLVIKPKAIWVVLTSIYGINRSSALKVLKTLDIDHKKKATELNNEDLQKIKKEIETNYTTGNDLKEKVSQFILDRIKIPYVGYRLSKGLPLGGDSKRNGSTAKKRRYNITRGI